jgi:Protein of unknown function (DUF3710)
LIFNRKSGRHAEGPGRSQWHGEEPPVPDRGPYDAGLAPHDDVERLDLGSLQIPAVEGVEVRVQADPDGTIQQVVLVHGESALQVGAFAAPRSEGIWDEVRAEILESMAADGVQAQEGDGPYGPELRARADTPQGPVALRFVGVDGPRWMIRAVYQGEAAADPSREGPLAQCLAGLIVDRGTDARPVREPLPLRLPREMAEQARQHAQAEQERLGQHAPGQHAPGQHAQGQHAQGPDGAGVNGRRV